MHYLLLVFFLLPPLAFAQGNYAGTYIGQNLENDSILKLVSRVKHKLTLEKDSSFTYLKVSNDNSCNSNYAGFWEIYKGKIVLNFIGEDPQWMTINEGKGFCALESRRDQLSLSKQGQRHYELGSTLKSETEKQKKKSKEPPCPSF
ncbi:MAG: hypothetical protein M3Q58_00025 [Bacteroidota bacterium]|nr:hypothetical protein [Bacteroidota bacterium]